MILQLNIYTDETLTEVERVVEADRLKIPYRVALTIGEALDELDLDTLNDNDVFKLITGNVDKVDKIIKATFGVKDSELERVDVVELGNVAVELFKWGMDKISSLKGGQEKN